MLKSWFVELMEGAVRAEITAYYGIPKSASKRARADMLSR